MREIEGKSVVAKFGGTSLASAERIKKVAEIVAENPQRREIVVSAPGKGKKEDEKIKVTDLLLDCNKSIEQGLSFEENFHKVTQRFEEIGRGLDCHSAVVGWLNNVDAGLRKREKRDWIASRGEWMSAQIIAKFIGGVFVDATRLIRLEGDGRINPLTYQLIREQLTDKFSVYVIPGYYGLHEQSADRASVKCFVRGGSDITGAIIAKGVGADLYENWTDVDGIRSAAPNDQIKLLKNPKAIKEITYSEMRELAYRGADVLQMDAVLPVIAERIPINLRNTFKSNHPGTNIVFSRESLDNEAVIGIAGRKGFVSCRVEKVGMNQQKGVARRVLAVFEENNISFDHAPTGLDSMSVIFHKDQLDGKKEKILADLERTTEPDNIYIKTGLGLVCVVGQNIAKQATNVHAKLYNALRRVRIDARAAVYGEEGNSIVIALDEERLTDAIKALYAAFIK